MKRIVFLLFAVIMLVQAMPLSVSANLPDLSEKNKIEVTVKCGDEIIPGGFISLYCVARAELINGRIEYALTENFADCKVDLSSDTENIIETVSAYINRNRIEGDRKAVDNSGRVTYSFLNAGYYIGIQDQAGEGYVSSNPFAVCVPMLSSEGEYEYTIEVNAKTEPVDKETIKDTTTRKPVIPGVDLPQTGQLKWPVPILAVFGVGFVTIGCILIVSNKRHKNEK